MAIALWRIRPIFNDRCSLGPESFILGANTQILQIGAPVSKQKHQIHRLLGALMIHFCFLLAFAQLANAKIADPEPLTDSGVRYQSHENYIDAIDSQSGTTKWHVELYHSIYPLAPNPFVEGDVQWNIISSMEIHGDTLIVQDSKRNRYLVQKSTGKLLGEFITPEHHYGLMAVFGLFLVGISVVIRKKSTPRFDDLG